MIKVSFHYAYREGGRFDVDYYCTKHMPRAAELMGSALRGWSVDVGSSGVAPGSAPAFVVVAHTLFDTVEAFRQAIGPGAKELQEDLVNYSDGEPPVIQISEVRPGA
jgi:uncharacterized protein (TIGR02118 family)